jgi:hypothetical protein
MDIDKSNKNGLLKIAYNCRKATFLIEKKQISQISIREAIELKIHLAGCSVCKIFEKQSLLINKLIRGMVGNHVKTEMWLDDGFKKELQQRILKKMNQN